MKQILFSIFCLLLPICAFAQNTVTAKAYVLPVVDGDTLDNDDATALRSAPVEIRFEAITEQEPANYIWKIIEVDRETREPIRTYMRLFDSSFTHKFKDAGLFYVYLEVAPDIADERYFVLNIDEADLKLPNAFSPNGDGRNDIYKVSCTSIVRFKVSIYNRWGKLLRSWQGESLKDWEGWDGKVRGKDVPTGVYFIIVDAQGADGRVYKLSKDINVLR